MKKYLKNCIERFRVFCAFALIVSARLSVFATIIVGSIYLADWVGGFPTETLDRTRTILCYVPIPAIVFIIKWIFFGFGNDDGNDNDDKVEEAEK